MEDNKKEFMDKIVDAINDSIDHRNMQIDSQVLTVFIESIVDDYVIVRKQAQAPLCEVTID